MKALSAGKNQRGGIAIIMGITIAVLVGFLGMVGDLGRLYIRKSELQNAADAATLAGAKELNGTLAGVNNAVAEAIAEANSNSSDFGATPVAISNGNIEFASSPYPASWNSVADAQANPADKYFIKVDTTGIAQGTRATWFMPALSVITGGSAIASTTTFGRAVAGRSVCNAMPIFTCSLPGGTAGNNYGYNIGRSYPLVPSPGSIGPGNVGYLHPFLDQTTNPGCAGVSSMSTPTMQRFACTGFGACAASSNRCTVTQPARPQIARAINTRFNQYPGSLPADLTPQLCTPDRNIRQYVWDSGSSGSPRNWMNPIDPTQQPELNPAAPAMPGVQNSFARPSPIPPGWTYPGSGSPYSQTGGQYFLAPTNPPDGQQPRRLLNLGIATGCPVAGGTGSPVTIVATGQFFMQVAAVETPSSSPMIVAEFAGLLPPSGNTVTAQIKLYQ